MKRGRGRLRLLLAAAGGAAAAWLLSPQEGARRRAQLRDGVRSRTRRAAVLGGRLARDLRNRALGAGARLRGALAAEEVSDAKLEQRVRSRLGHESSHPGALAVEAQDGSVVLRGPILSDEADRVVRAARSVRGVARVEDRLERHCAADGVPALQGEGRTREH